MPQNSQSGNSPGLVTAGLVLVSAPQSGPSLFSLCADPADKLRFNIFHMTEVRRGLWDTGGLWNKELIAVQAVTLGLLWQSFLILLFESEKDVSLPPLSGKAARDDFPFKSKPSETSLPHALSSHPPPPPPSHSH